VNRLESIFRLPLAAAFLACVWGTCVWGTCVWGACAAVAQQSVYEQLRGKNTAMTAVQPTWMSPLIEPDVRVTQSLRLSFSNSYTAAGTQTVNYGNFHGLGVLAGDRVQINLIAPAYIQNNSATAKDGFGDPMGEVKFRIASGNAEHGNYALTAMVAETLPTGSYANGAATAVYYPNLAAGKMWGRFDVQTTLGGMMPTGKIAAQGRQIDWNTTAQVLVGRRLWLDLENNAIYNYGGPFDSRTENFLTPAAFYVVRRRTWQPTHCILILDAGMQIATSHFHTCNHNLIPEARIVF
jgi:hypothetical protein